MTREEAIKELENMKKFNYTLAPLEVFDMAIKALWAVEHMPTPKNDLEVEHHKQNIQAYAHDFGVSEEQAEKELKVYEGNGYCFLYEPPESEDKE